MTVTPERTAALPAGKPPAGNGQASRVAVVAAIALIGAGVLGVQNLLVQLDVTTSPSWLAALVTAADGVHGDSPGVVIAGTVAVLVGIGLLPGVVGRRPRTELALQAGTGVHLRPRDLERIAQARLDGADTLVSARVSARRRRLHVVAVTVADRDRNEAVVADVHERLRATLDTLQHPPRISVSVVNQGL